MKRSYIKQMGNLIQYLKCKFTYMHDYYSLEQLSTSTKKIGCRYCKRIFAMNYDVNVVLPWDTDLEEFYIYTKKLMKSFNIKD